LEGLGGATPALVIGYANLTHAAVKPAVAALAASIKQTEAKAPPSSSHRCSQPGRPRLELARKVYSPVI
jgi:hypothetical protein